MAGTFVALLQPQPEAAEGGREMGCLGWGGNLKDTEETSAPLPSEQLVR